MTALYPNCFMPRLWRFPRVQCQGLGLVVMMLFVTSAVFGASVQEHIFTDLEGRTMSAKIVQVIEPNVFLQSGSGPTFPVKIGAFTAKDQSYIQQWMLNNQKTAAPFGVFALKSAVSVSPGNLPQQGFKVTLKNLTGKDQSNLRIDYVVLRQPSSAIVAPLPRISGTATITAVAKNGIASIDTALISVKGGRLAVWVRIFNAQGKLLQEWSSDPSMSDAEEWNSTSKNTSTAGASRGGRSSGGGNFEGSNQGGEPSRGPGR